MPIFGSASSKICLMVPPAAQPSTFANPYDWVPASDTYNWVLDNPLLDWLDMHGEANGYSPDEHDIFEAAADFLTFIRQKGRDFEQRVLSLLWGQIGGEIDLIDASPPITRPDLDATLAAMASGSDAIWQGALLDAATGTCGIADLLIRSDVLAALFPEAISQSASMARSPNLRIGNRHYVVVDIKYSTLYLDASGSLSTRGSSAAHKAQIYIYNQALGNMQGYTPPGGYVLGRSWKPANAKSRQEGAANCLDRLAFVPSSQKIAQSSLSAVADQAVAWRRRLKAQGASWTLLPPSVPELRPDAGGNNGRWAHAVASIVEDGEDLSRLWQVGVRKRREANTAQLERWSDLRVTGKSLHLGAKASPVVDAILDVNRHDDLTPVRPAHVSANRSKWIYPESGTEFFVDFETVSDLNDDFALLPDRGGQPLIFMIGCGHVEDEEWQFSCFVTETLTKPEEARIIQDWLSHMTDVCARLEPGTVPRVFHWSRHERVSLRQAEARHPKGLPEWEGLRWFDLLSQVIQAEPVVVRGAFGFSLKEIAGALHELGLIDTQWDSESSIADGSGAMVAAWRSQEAVDAGEASGLGALGLMGAVMAYNEVDCRTMREILEYLRENH